MPSTRNKKPNPAEIRTARRPLAAQRTFRDFWRMVLDQAADAKRASTGARGKRNLRTGRENAQGTKKRAAKAIMTRAIGGSDLRQKARHGSRKTNGAHP